MSWEAYGQREDHKLSLSLPEDTLNKMGNSMTAYVGLKSTLEQRGNLGLPDLTLLRKRVEPAENILRFYIVVNHRLKLAYSGSTVLKMFLRLLVADDDLRSGIKDFKEEADTEVCVWGWSSMTNIYPDYHKLRELPEFLIVEFFTGCGYTFTNRRVGSVSE